MESADIRGALLQEMHRAIDDAANHTMQMLAGRHRPAVMYPPGADFTDAELRALQALALHPEARSALHKLLRDTASAPLFALFTLIDGVGDPHGWRGRWHGAVITTPDDKDPNAALWHDDFYASYWRYAERVAPDV